MAPLLDELLALARDVAASAADLLLDGLRREHIEVDTKSTATDMVTEIDRASEALITHRILDARPNDGIVGEEGAHEASTSGVRWIIDPIDGTTNYVYAFPGFSVSIAAELDGETVVGVVHDPLHRERFEAVRNGGATRNGAPIHASTKRDLATALVGTGFAYDAARRRAQAAVLAEIIGEVRDVRRMGSAAVDLCSVACGRLDAYYERGLGPWDLAAGALIAAEAGAVLGDLDGGPASGGFVLAAAPELFGPLRSILRAAGAGTA